MAVPGIMDKLASIRSEQEVSVRLPPYLDPAIGSSTSTTTSFVAPSLDHYTGTWYMTNTSRSSWLHYSNLQWDLWPVVPSCFQNDTSICPPGTVAGQMIDFTTWVLEDKKENSATKLNFGARGGGNRSVSSTWGYDTPARLGNSSLSAYWDGVWNVNFTDGVIAGFRQSWAVVYSGTDAKGFDFMILHETGGPVRNYTSADPCLDAVTRNPEGPDAGSMETVLDAARDLGNGELSTLIKDLGAVKWDHNLQGGPAICGEDCMKNQAHN